jgi:hypothetical protein
LPAPPNNAIGVDLTAFQSTNHFFDVQVLNAPAAISPGQYNGWCVEEFVDINVTGTTTPSGYNGQVFSSCDPNINTYLANEPSAVNGNWPAVNYILNHSAGYLYSDVQAAIWYFVGSGYSPAAPTPYPVGPSNVPYPFVPNQANVNVLVAAANANTAAWVAAGHPMCGDITAAVLLFDTAASGDIQLLIIEVPCTCSPCNGQIGDFVWNDVNGNGCQDAGEPGIPGVKVDLYSGGCGSNGTYIATATTDSTGHYLFSGLCAGAYQVVITTPNGYTASAPTNGCGTNPNLPPSSNQLDSKCSCNAASPCTNCVTLTAANPVNLNVDCGYKTTLNLACAAVSTGTVGVPYTSSLVVGGGCSPYTFSISGSLPDGLNLNTSTGVISGTPTKAGVFNYTAQVTDSCGNTATTLGRSCIITIVPPLTLACGSGTGTVGVPMTLPLVTTGGQGPFTYSITSGSLPPGITLNPATGVISGTPTTAGTYNYTAKVVDSLGKTATTPSAGCTITICGSSVCGTVYADCDGSGDLSGGDVGYKDVVVTLKDAQGHVVTTVKTDVNGNYCFYNLAAGNYTVAIVQPYSCKQTAGTTTHHWKDNYGKICWKDNDNYTHWKDSNNTDCWNANDGYMHWKDSYGRDCWKDRYGNNHWQNCNYVSCDARVDNTEPVTLRQCEAQGDVDFAYMGTAPKTQVCVSGPTRAKCGDTITYTCKVSNLGNVCFTGGCKVQVCGQWFTCPNLSPGQDWTCKKDYKVQWGDAGTLNCHVTATCYPAGGGNVSNDSTCSTQVGWQ